MPPIIDVVKGALRLNSIPERNCFKSWNEFVERLPELLTVEVPASVTGVIRSNVQPADEESSKLWLREDVSGNVLGLYAFQNGKWRPLYPYKIGDPVPMIGNSSNIPEGFELIEPGNPHVPAIVASTLPGQYIPDGFGNFAFFWTVYVGF